MTIIQPRRPIFVGGEGASERSYCRFLDHLAKEQGLHVHIEAVDLGGGDASICLDRAIRAFGNYRSRAGNTTPGFVLLDTDGSKGSTATLHIVAARHELTIIWQSPCHEALLLRHFAGQENRQPHDCTAAGKLLCNQWSTFTKNTPAIRISKTLGLDHVKRAGSVTPALQELIDEIGL